MHACRAHLSQVVESSAMGLETPLSEGGAPFSTGQKQLLALARALLNPSRILVLVSGPASVIITLFHVDHLSLQPVAYFAINRSTLNRQPNFTDALLPSHQPAFFPSASLTSMCHTGGALGRLCQPSLTPRCPRCSL